MYWDFGQNYISIINQFIDMNLNFKGFADQITDLSSMKLGIYQSKTKSFMEFGLYSLVAYFMPLMIVQQQMFLGVAVNSMLVCSALYVKGLTKLLPLIVLPSIGVLSKGFILPCIQINTPFSVQFANPIALPRFTGASELLNRSGRMAPVRMINFPSILSLRYLAVSIIVSVP